MLRYRYLFSQLVRRELRQKYKGSALGVLWYLVNPLVLMGAYTLMFGFVLPLRRYSDYPIFLIVGLVVWTFFQQSLLASAESLIQQAGLVRKARFPRQAIPASSVAVQAVTLGTMLMLLIFVAVPIRGTFGAQLLLLPLMGVLLFGFVLGCSLIVSVLHAYYRDVAPVLTAMLLPWFFLTPTFFEPSQFAFVQRHAIVGTVLQWVNPIAPFIEAMRSVLYWGTAPDGGRLLYMGLAAAISMALGGAVFRRLDGELAVVL